MRMTVKIAFLGLRLSFLASCAISPQGRAAPLSGVVSGETRWQGTVSIDGDLGLEEEARLVIAPGTEVFFLPPAEGKDLFTPRPNFPGSELIVRGTLIVEGTAEKPITFRFVDPDAPAGSWGGINLRESPEVRFRFVRITQANSAIHSHNSKAVIEASRIVNNLFGLRFNSTEFLIRNNPFRDNGTAIRFQFGAPVIRNNLITDNEKGIFITSYPSEYRIEGNNIVGNHRYAVVLGEEVPDDVQMAGNYWGTDSPISPPGVSWPP
ncbi:hypothetical protein A7E78_04450 [Syntrophotalea acetylenivorans]|uniref:Right handed beta helix domain-containing protein n=1 Tax=Syntrophotalea acetylenivorans TaxID=1842532 RepID=A0A1L3GMN3_9BACT|nr:right-handed parallel beta-helix repeat-containing protein [Syntrophotalea acetylenivorans]APG27151.1 hypothetical protein A7E78_04450 [Syntrophotalea acetylenivorans]